MTNSQGLNDCLSVCLSNALNWPNVRFQGGRSVSQEGRKVGRIGRFSRKEDRVNNEANGNERQTSGIPPSLIVSRPVARRLRQ